MVFREPRRFFEVTCNVTYKKIEQRGKAKGCHFADRLAEAPEPDRALARTDSGRGEPLAEHTPQRVQAPQRRSASGGLAPVPKQRAWAPRFPAFAPRRKKNMSKAKIFGEARSADIRSGSEDEALTDLS